MTKLTELDELSRKATQDYDMEVRIVKCSCGHPSCDRHGLNIGMFPQGAGWDRNYAEFIAALVNYWRNGGSQVARDGERLDWVEQNLCRAGDVVDNGKVVGIMKCWQIVTQRNDSIRETIDTLRAALSQQEPKEPT